MPILMCPQCQQALGELSSVLDHASPTVGDLSICGGCLAILKFTSLTPIQMGLANEAEQAEFRSSEGGRTAMALCAATKAFREKRNYQHWQEGNA